MTKLHLECCYGGYHGQDPRTFDPDVEVCTPTELAHHKAAVELAERGEWKDDDSGCKVGKNIIVCRTSMGLGTYSVVLDSEGEFVRDATYDDLQRDTYEWAEENPND